MREQAEKEKSGQKATVLSKMRRRHSPFLWRGHRPEIVSTFPLILIHTTSSQEYLSPVSASYTDDTPRRGGKGCGEEEKKRVAS